MNGRTVSHYAILQTLGRGGMGVVYKAHDTQSGRPVALKFQSGFLSASEREQSRFQHEAEAGAALEHPNICKVYGMDRAEGMTFIVMGYLEGKDLGRHIASGPLDIEQALAIAEQTAQGLQQAHEKGIVHRDIKSANIMLTPEGQAVILDFGLALRSGDPDVDTIDSNEGTAAYMSPEQILDEKVDLRTDVWALGVVLYEMLTGQLPFPGRYREEVVYSIVHEVPKPVSALRPEVSLELERIVIKAMEKDPGKRYQNAASLIADLRAVRRTYGHRRHNDIQFPQAGGRPLD
jgi:serine/threonine protein kinase